MQTTADKPGTRPPPEKAANAKPPDIALASVPDTLAALKVDPETGLTHAEVDIRRK
jgi:H+-transporting ATPase